MLSGTAPNFKYILGEDALKKVEDLASTSSDFSRYIIEFVYGDIYEREKLSHRDRELAVVASMLGRGVLTNGFRLHIKGMLNVGWTHEELIQIFIHLFSYVGFPTCLDAIIILKELMDAESETLSTN